MADKYQNNLELLKNNDEELLNYSESKVSSFPQLKFFLQGFSIWNKKLS